MEGPLDHLGRGRFIFNTWTTRTIDSKTRQGLSNFSYEHSFLEEAVFGISRIPGLLFRMKIPSKNNQGFLNLCYEHKFLKQ